jgi:isochorismatase family protein
VLPNVAAIARHAPATHPVHALHPAARARANARCMAGLLSALAGDDARATGSPPAGPRRPACRSLPPGPRHRQNGLFGFRPHPLAPFLRSKGIGTLIVTGGETDVCVLATVMAAIDLGFRVVLPTDALCSARDRTHDALMTLYRERFTHQVETTTTERVLRDWTV